MKKAVTLLMLLNLTSYISNFAFAFISAYDKVALKSNLIIQLIWILSPFVFLTVTSFILATDNKEEYKIFKTEAIIDWIIRLLSCCLVFQEFNFKFLSNRYILQQVVLSSFLIINIYLEFKMYKKAQKYVPIKKENMETEKISEKEKHNIREMGQSSTLGVVSFFVFSGLIIANRTCPLRYQFL